MRQTAPRSPETLEPATAMAGRASARRGAALTGLLDAALLAGGLGLNFWIWLGFVRLGHIPPEYVLLFSYLVLPLVVVRLALLWVGGLYRTLTPHLGFHELTVIAAADTAATVALVVFNLLSPSIPSLGPSFPLDATGAHILRIPWGIVANDWMVSLIVLGGVRFVRHQYETWLLRSHAPGARRTLIVGTGDAAARLARDLLAQTRGDYLPVGLVDPDGGAAGLRVHGLEVLGGAKDIATIAQSAQAGEIVIALERPSPRLVGEIVGRLSQHRVGLKIVPDLKTLMRGGVEVSAMRPVQIEDLLGRSAVNLHEGGAHAGLKSRRVLITGAGGSIGAELARQALASDPASLALVDIGENSLFELLQELEPAAAERKVPLGSFVGDVADGPFVERVFSETSPEIVFHAAAHKHVHLMESQPAEAIRNNVGGTLCVAQAAARHRVRRLVFISTDKAVHPAGVMGATKRIGELIVAAMAVREGLDFVSVRFGNVLGSRGSVLPTFQRQIARGGPVTVTDREATRYFMTVDEAVSLLIEAGTEGRGGSILILNMGKPVRIDDLARNAIRLSGFEPDRDIAIVYTGLRPGERLQESLVTGEESTEAAQGGRILVAKEAPPDWEALEPLVGAMLEASARRDDDAARRFLEEALTTATAPAPSASHAPLPQTPSSVAG